MIDQKNAYRLMVFLFLFQAKPIFCQELIRVSLSDSCVYMNCRLYANDFKNLRKLCPSYQCKISAYTVSYTENGKQKKLVLNTNYWGKALLPSIKPGAEFVFEKIVEITPDGQSKKMPDIRVKLYE